MFSVIISDGCPRLHVPGSTDGPDRQQRPVRLRFPAIDVWLILLPVPLCLYNNRKETVTPSHGKYPFLSTAKTQHHNTMNSHYFIFYSSYSLFLPSNPQGLLFCFVVFFVVTLYGFQWKAYRVLIILLFTFYIARY